MPQLDNIEAAQKSLEECFTKRMEQLESQLHCTGPSKDTVSKVAEEFRTFRELMYSMLGLLRRQITQCSQAVDALETRHRRKALLLMGVAESDSENCSLVVLDIIKDKLHLKGYTEESFTICHRLGPRNKDHHRPILVRFRSTELRTSIWRAKTALKGSSISIREFLTKIRQTVFTKARNHYGTRACWTQDGAILIKVPDGKRLKVTSVEELSDLISKHPKAPLGTESQSRSGTKKNVSPGPYKNAPVKA